MASAVKQAGQYSFRNNTLRNLSEYGFHRLFAGDGAYANDRNVKSIGSGEQNRAPGVYL